LKFLFCEKFFISENDIICAEAAKVLRYLFTF
jgi:hypothetical protein